MPRAILNVGGKLPMFAAAQNQNVKLQVEI